ncbi:MAG: NADH-ubiquinone oxidoreductase-F iron-sulfur binding region domain-containing protein [Kineosporiaceae bacterium]|jgi:NADH:ubiquinone oxidoreductase subunit F (NADH-binding)
MTGYVVARAGYASDIAVIVGQRLLSGIQHGPGLVEHRATWAEPPHLPARDLLAVLTTTQIRGRGGAGFPFARKVATAVESGRRRVLVVNASEGEPGSAKDSALMMTAPHLVLDGAQIVARALGVKLIHVVVPGERPAVLPCVEAAIAERTASGQGVRYEVFETSGGFVGGQARAVIEMLEGRENLPVTAWEPEAVSGYRGRPTLLSNAETFAQAAALVALGPGRFAAVGTADEPGTTLLTVAGDGPGGVVLEVPLGTSLAEVLRLCGYEPDITVLLGGYHGTWLAPHQARTRRMSRADLGAVGATLGAGIVLPLDRRSCPVTLTAAVVDYLAGQSARRCGPCKNGLPALAEACTRLAGGAGPDATERIDRLVGSVTGRGACAHPDGTARLVRSLLVNFAHEVAAHERGFCEIASGVTV